MAASLFMRLTPVDTAPDFSCFDGLSRDFSALLEALDGLLQGNECVGPLFTGVGLWDLGGKSGGAGTPETLADTVELFFVEDELDAFSPPLLALCCSL